MQDELTPEKLDRFHKNEQAVKKKELEKSIKNFQTAMAKFLTQKEVIDKFLEDLQKSSSKDKADLSQLYDADNDGVFQTELSDQISTSVLGYINKHAVSYFGTQRGVASSRTRTQDEESVRGQAVKPKKKKINDPLIMAPQIFQKPSNVKKLVNYMTKKEVVDLSEEDAKQQSQEKAGMQAFVTILLNTICTSGTAFHDFCYNID